MAEVDLPIKISADGRAIIGEVATSVESLGGKFSISEEQALGFKEGVESVAKSLEGGVGTAISNSGALLGAWGTAAVAAGGFATHLADEFGAWGNALVNQSTVTRLSIPLLSSYNDTAKVTGVTAETVAGNMEKLGANIASGSKKFADGAALLGLSANELKAAAPEERLQMIGDAIRNVGVGSDAAQAAVKDLFGKGGLGMLPALSEEAESYRERVHEVVETILGDETTAAAAAKDWEGNVNLVGVAFESMKLRLGGAIAQSVTDIGTLAGAAATFAAGEVPLVDGDAKSLKSGSGLLGTVTAWTAALGNTGLGGAIAITIGELKALHTAAIAVDDVGRSVTLANGKVANISGDDPNVTSKTTFGGASDLFASLGGGDPKAVAAQADAASKVLDDQVKANKKAADEDLRIWKQENIDKANEAEKEAKEEQKYNDELLKAYIANEKRKVEEARTTKGYEESFIDEVNALADAYLRGMIADWEAQQQSIQKVETNIGQMGTILTTVGQGPNSPMGNMVGKSQSLVGSFESLVKVGGPIHGMGDLIKVATGSMTGFLGAVQAALLAFQAIQAIVGFIGHLFGGGTHYSDQDLKDIANDPNAIKAVNGPGYNPGGGPPPDHGVGPGYGPPPNSGHASGSTTSAFLAPTGGGSRSSAGGGRQSVVVHAPVQIVIDGSKSQTEQARQLVLILQDNIAGAATTVQRVLAGKR